MLIMEVPLSQIDSVELVLRTLKPALTQMKDMSVRHHSPVVWEACALRPPTSIEEDHIDDAQVFAKNSVGESASKTAGWVKAPWVGLTFGSQRVSDWQTLGTPVGAGPARPTDILKMFFSVQAFPSSRRSRKIFRSCLFAKCSVCSRWL